jgi:hypothetical protein
MILGIDTRSPEASRLVDGLFSIVGFNSLAQDTTDQDLEIEDVHPAVAIEIDA